MKFLLISILSLFAANAFALGPLYVDFHGSAGKGTLAVKDEDKSPDAYQYGLGATVGWKLAMFYLGVSADYYKVAQTTKPDDSFGNRSGVRTNLFSPTLGISLGNIRLKADYQFKGNYKLDKKTSGGDAVTYEDPNGYRIYGGYRTGDMSEIGVFYESVSYGKEIVGSTDKKLDNKLNVSQVGLMLILRI